MITTHNRWMLHLGDAPLTGLPGKTHNHPDKGINQNNRKGGMKNPEPISDGHRLVSMPLLAQACQQRQEEKKSFIPSVWR